jgi:hypothetical protein
MPKGDVSITVRGVDQASEVIRRAADLARIAEIDALVALSDEDLCERHSDTVRLKAPERCRVTRWVNEKPTDCPYEAWWSLNNDRHGIPATHACTKGAAEYLRSRLWLDRRALERGMA